MSKLNIKRAVENIRANTTVYTPVVEMIVNGIQAIDETGRNDGKVSVMARRSAQSELDGSLPEIVGFDIVDNGIGFTHENRDSFDTLYTDHKIGEGGKGFGRLTALKYFENLYIKSDYRFGDGVVARSFSMGKEHEFIVNETENPSNRTETGSTVTLVNLKKNSVFEKKLSTVARNLVERLLPYFIDQNYVCPDIVLCEQDGTSSIYLNNFVSNELSADIREISVESNAFTAYAIDDNEEFQVRIFKLYSPRKQSSRVSLVAHKREVLGSPIYKYVPEFKDEFLEGNPVKGTERNYIVRAYVFGPYLDRHVSLERGGFEFAVGNEDNIFGIGQSRIEQRAAEIAREAMGEVVESRQLRKKRRVQNYVDEKAPWHKAMMEKIDLSSMPYDPSNEEIELRLQKEKYVQEVEVRRDVAGLLNESSLETVKGDVAEIVNKVSDTSKNDLIHYIALRRTILDLLGKSLEKDETGKYASEGVVHDIIFPRKGDSDTTRFRDHNLWIVDERMNFTTWVSSDNALGAENKGRPDVLCYNRSRLFRGDNEASNPITIFEFKRPQRDDFVNTSSKEDPVQQIVRYVNDIRDDKYKTPEGRKIQVTQNTPCYGYVICDLTKKVETWLDREKNFTAMPDSLGWFHWMGNINLYIEVISWDKVLKDAKMRNQIFFHKLGIE